MEARLTIARKTLFDPDAAQMASVAQATFAAVDVVRARSLERVRVRNRRRYVGRTGAVERGRMRLVLSADFLYGSGPMKTATPTAARHPAPIDPLIGCY